MPTYDEIQEEAFAEEEAEFFQSDDSQEQSSSPHDDSMALLPDGIGMAFEETRMMLSAMHNTMLAKEEPILMMITFGNALLTELDKLHKKHNQAVTKIMAEQSAKYIKSVAEKSDEFVIGVKQSSDALGAALKESSVDAIRDIFNSHATVLNDNKNNARWCAAIMAVAALVNVAVTLWR